VDRRLEGGMAPAPTRPGGMAKQDAQEKLAEVPGVARVRVEVVFDPPLDASRMTEAARLQSGLL
jgi:metal-sulfur cluster biosynthetic enzyme